MARPRSCHCGECFKCKRADYMRRWWNNLTPEQRREKTARRNPELVREQERRKQERRRREGTPEQKQRIIARRAVSNALQAGKLERQPCEVCGRRDYLHAHHKDHSRPLDINWLCRPCHDALHREAA